MMHQDVTELLSRHLDGDLSDVEERQLRRRLAAEPKLGTELEAMRQLCRAVSRMADDAVAPARLDRLVEALRRDPLGSGSRRRPWLRRLAAAAALVLGATVAVEVARHRQSESGTAIDSLRRVPTTTQRSEPYRLRPLPTSSLPEQEAPLGAADRLLASPLPEPSLEDPPPLEILGPLARPPHRPTVRATLRPRRRATLTLHATERQHEIPLDVEIPPAIRSMTLWISVVDGVISNIAGRDQDPQLPPELPSALIGLPVHGVTNGRYSADLHVDRPM